MANLPTIRIIADTSEGYAIVNEKDFDPKLHKRWTDAKPKSATSHKQAEEPSP